MITKEMLKKYANLLMFDMKDEEYTTLEEEFKSILEQMEKISGFKNIENVEPMVFINEEEVSLREDVVGDYLTVSEVLENTKVEVDNQVKVPKVVDEDV